MMIDNFLNIRTFDAVHCLALFVVIHKDNPFAAGPQKVSAGNHPLIMTVFIQNGEVPVTLAGHHLFDIINKIIFIKGGQMLGFHKIADGHTLVNQTGSRIGIVGRGDNYAAPLLCHLADGFGNPRPLADNNTACFHLNGTKLGFIAVS